MGTSIVANLSVNSRIGTFSLWACSTSLMICDSMVSRPSPVTSTCSIPFFVMVPATALAPGRFSTGMGSRHFQGKPPPRNQGDIASPTSRLPELVEQKGGARLGRFLFMNSHGTVNP
jgi:hypothetical protein